MRFLYSLFLQFCALFIKLAAPFSPKAKLWCEGRKDVFLFLKKNCTPEKEIVWVHCASLGEIEQGKTLMEKIKQEEKNVTLLVTFFSPSGFEVKKNDPIAEIITYLPIDTPKNAKKFINIVKPQKVFFIKYEYWFNYMLELYRANIPFYYISAIFREKHYFFKNYGKWFLKQLKMCSYFFVQNEKSKILLQQNGISQAIVSGDTRVDRVCEIARQHTELDFISAFKEDKKLLVAGSTWKPDEKLLAELLINLNSDYKLVVAPHLVDNNRIHQIKKLFNAFPTVCLSESEGKDISKYKILIIDSIGVLRKIYKYADFSYVGGAFKTGLHNILEPIVFEKPVFFGPHFHKFNEAAELVEKGAAFPVTTANEMAKHLNHFKENPSSYSATCEICKKYIQQNLGATEKIWLHLIFIIAA
jgi:3-deoxy-D-manno-octulosonic-acid transferase